MKKPIKLVLALLLGIVLNTNAQDAQKYHKGDTVYNKKTKVIYVIDSLQYRKPTAKSWTTNFYTAHYPGDTKYFSYDIVESALIVPTKEQWTKIHKKRKENGDE